MPAGLSLKAIPGFQALAGNVANTATKATAEASSGLGKLLVPGAIIAALIGAAIFFMNSGGKKAVDSLKGTATGAAKSIKSQLEKLDPIIERISALPGIGDAIKQVLTQLKEKLASFAG